jgi:hypothetical protein
MKFKKGDLVELANNVRPEIENGVVAYYSAGHQLEVLYSDGNLAKVKDASDSTKFLVPVDDLQLITPDQSDDVHVGRSRIVNGR